MVCILQGRYSEAAAQAGAQSSDRPGRERFGASRLPASGGIPPERFLFRPGADRAVARDRNAENLACKTVVYIYVVRRDVLEKWADRR